MAMTWLLVFVICRSRCREKALDLVKGQVMGEMEKDIQVALPVHSSVLLSYSCLSWRTICGVGFAP